MSGVLDPNSSSQRWMDGSRAFCAENNETENSESCVNLPDTQVPDNSDDELYDNLTTEVFDKPKNDQNGDSDNSTDSVSMLKRTNSLAIEVAEKVLDSIDQTHLVQGTHVHVRNGKIHLCSMPPFEMDQTGTRIDDREKIIHVYLRQMETHTFDRIFDLFQQDGQLIYNPLKRKFKKKYATDLFNVSSYQKFSYDCLTPADCEKLRQHYLMLFNISQCRCRGKNCFDFSAFIPSNI